MQIPAFPQQQGRTMAQKADFMRPRISFVDRCYIFSMLDNEAGGESRGPTWDWSFLSPNSEHRVILNPLYSRGLEGPLLPPPGPDLEASQHWLSLNSFCAQFCVQQAKNLRNPRSRPSIQ
ncbi:oncomodulin-1 isoform X11 [Pan troglodytes]|uniref:oncomodulin-1 isoform X11 n=1 Tax=Pan troglodytes TaxID=9598 RepID=UPI0023F31844|nr:oncomodulin-1 isoform X4 [Pan troglodytes]